ncbi:MAG: SulP family inorganic anion transporter [Verrucomicrobiales bacterium]
MRRFLLENTLELLPVRRHLAHYSKSKFRHDLLAGGNVALLAIAQGLAFAVMAGLPSSYGITCAALAAMVGPLLASSRHTVLGPTNATAFMVFSSLAGLSAAQKLEMMPVLIFVAGSLLVIGAYFRLADLIQYVSRTVVVAYLGGSSLLIVANQFKAVAGLPTSSAPRGPQTFVTVMRDIAHHISNAHGPSLGIAALTLGLYIVLKRKAPRLPAFALVLLATSLASEGLLHLGITLQTLEGFSMHDLLPVVPDLRDLTVWDRLSPLFGVAMAIAFLAALESSVMAKSLASRTGDRVDVNQEMLSVGAANLACSFLSGMPASGSLTRSALNQASGAVTQVASLVSGLVCTVAAVSLGPWLAHVPRASLAMLVICVAASLVNRRHLRICLTATRSDAATLWMTLAATLLLPLHVAIFVGVATSIVFYLRKASRPELVEYEFNPRGDLAASEPGQRKHPAISIVHVEGALFFGAAELFRTQVQRLAADTHLRVIILRLKNARHLDATSVMALEELITFMRSKNRHLLLSGAMKDVYRVLKNSGLIEALGRDNLFIGSVQNPNLSTRNALKRAQELLGTREAEIHIYYDPGQSPQPPK